MRGWFNRGAGFGSRPVPHSSWFEQILRRIQGHDRAAADGSFLILVNAHHETISFAIPRLHETAVWSPVIDTEFEDGRRSGGLFEAGESYVLHGRSLAVLRTVRGRTLLPRTLAMV